MASGQGVVEHYYRAVARVRVCLAAAVCDRYTAVHTCNPGFTPLNYRLSYTLSFKRGSVQPGCILGGLRFRSTAIRFFKFVWYF